MGFDPVLAAVVGGAHVDRVLEIAPAALGFIQRLVALGEVGGAQGLVAGAQQELAVELGLLGDGGAVDPQLARRRLAQEALVGGLGGERAVEL